MQKNYIELLITLHGILIEAMKCKQTTDLAHTDTLRSLLNRFEALYLAMIINKGHIGNYSGV